jgi:hypothetical protein
MHLGNLVTYTNQLTRFTISATSNPSPPVPPRLLFSATLLINVGELGAKAEADEAKARAVRAEVLTFILLMFIKYCMRRGMVI